MPLCDECLLSGRCHKKFSVAYTPETMRNPLILHGVHNSMHREVITYNLTPIKMIDHLVDLNRYFCGRYYLQGEFVQPGTTRFVEFVPSTRALEEAPLNFLRRFQKPMPWSRKPRLRSEHAELWALIATILRGANPNVIWDLLKMPANDSEPSA